MRDRARPAQNFFDRSRHQRWIVQQSRALLRMLDEGQQPPGDRVARSLEPSPNVQEPVVGELAVAQFLAIDLSIPQYRQQVLTIAAAPLKRAFGAVFPDSPATLIAGLQWRARFHLVFSVFRAGDHV